ncbi:major facilitator superfamily domain-containing protein [Zopfochytrium polystomum]|nr:major facilitator superfamily domain-containing protein [Zopfochytrium polystomum]
MTEQRLAATPATAATSAGPAATASASALHAKDPYAASSTANADADAAAATTTAAPGNVVDDVAAADGWRRTTRAAAAAGSAAAKVKVETQPRLVSILRRLDAKQDGPPPSSSDATPPPPPPSAALPPNQHRAPAATAKSPLAASSSDSLSLAARVPTERSSASSSSTSRSPWSSSTSFLPTAPPPPTPPASSADDRQNLLSIVVLGVASFLIFMAYSVVQTLASSVIPYKVAFNSLGVSFFVLGFFSLVVAAPLVQRLGSRATLFISSTTYVVLEAAYLAAIKHAENPSVQATLFYTAQGTYVALAAGPNQNQGRLAGIMHGISALSGIVGPLVASALFNANVDLATVFAILCVVGAAGSTAMAVLWMRPEPGQSPTATADPPPAHASVVVAATHVTTTDAATPPKPAAFEPVVDAGGPVGDTEAGAVDETAVKARATTTTLQYRLLRTARVMVNPRMLMLAPLFYLISVETSFLSSSVPLFVKTGNQSQDLADKLHLSAAAGAANTLASFVVGPLTDRFGSARVIAAEALLHAATMAFLWAGNVHNNLPKLFVVSVLLGICDCILPLQTFKLIPQHFTSAHAADSLRPDNDQQIDDGDDDSLPRSPPSSSGSDLEAAFAAVRVHMSITGGTILFASPYALGADSSPRLDIWGPVVWALLAATVVGVTAADRRRTVPESADGAGPPRVG